MLSSKLWSGAALSALAVMLFAFPASGFADTYQIINLGSADSNSVYGLDVSGDVVIGGMTGCGALPYCYKTYTDGTESSVSAFAPTLDYDNGTSCEPVAQAQKGVCNGAFAAYGVGSEVFTDNNSLSAFLAFGSVDAIAMNSVGDLAWTDGLHEFNYEAIDLSTASTSPVPEPGSLALLATGLLGGVATLRRRLAVGA